MTTNINDEIIKNIEDNKSLIYKLANRYKSYYNIDDLYQAGCIGIIKATKKYDSNSKCKFSTYAFKYILGEMIDYIRKDKNIIVSEEIYNLYKKYIQVKELLFNKYEREVSFSEICEFMNIDEKYMLNIIESINVSKSIDEDEKVYNSLSIDNRNDIDNIILLRNELDSLCEFDRNIINYRYYEGYSQEETAKLLGINQVKVSRHEKLILTRIREKIAS
ncbi:MAG: sigma-70 family RNA polymerase sigma factor [Bacilli bacterium]|nr:sigma-70 family RNA polymerase sigma factor [Bacilli bacterium]